MARTVSRMPWTAGMAALTAIAVIAAVLHAAISHTSAGGRQAVTPTWPDGPAELIVYSGRAESLVGDLFDRFQRETGINVKVKYARTGPLAAMILEEGRRSPADVFFAQDPGGLGLLAERGRLAELPDDALERVHYAYRDPTGRWVGVTGRLRTIAWSTERLSEHDLPESILDLTDPQYHGRVGWAPANASFQALVTAMRREIGEARTEQWLREMMAAGVRTYPRNTPIIQAVADGEIDFGLVNHYYLHRFRIERGTNFPAANHIPAGRDGGGDLGGTMLVSGAGILDTARNRESAETFIRFLLSEEIQAHFVGQTFEYPLVNGATSAEDVPPLDQLPVHPVNLTELADLQATIAMLRRAGALR